MLNPPFLKNFSREQRSPAVTKSGTLYYPMWLSYAAGVLEQEGYQLVLVDCPADDIDLQRVLRLVAEYRPDVVVLDTSTPSIYNDARVAGEIKSLLPQTFMVLVGTHVSAMPVESMLLNESIDAVAIGEYDYTIYDLVKKMDTKGNPEEIPGLALKKNGKVFLTPGREPPGHLDQIPFVSRVYKKHLNYRRYFYAHCRYPVVTIITGRGCPHQCSYCVYPQVFSGRKIRYRSIVNVVDEIEFILSDFPDVKELMFEDDTLTLSKKRCFELAEEILRRGLKFTWSANSRADVDLETMVMLKRAGARLFCVGVESGVQEILDGMKKNLKVERINKFFEDAKKAGIKVHGCFMVGNAGETRETLGKTLEFAKKLNPDTAQFFPLMVYPGTEAYRWAKEKGFLKTEDYREWLTEEGLHNTVISRPELTAEDLVNFCDRARREFYLRPKYILSKVIEGLKEPLEFKRLFKGGIKLAGHIFKPGEKRVSR